MPPDSVSGPAASSWARAGVDIAVAATSAPRHARTRIFMDRSLIVDGSSLTAARLPASVRVRSRHACVDVHPIFPTHKRQIDNARLNRGDATLVQTMRRDVKG